ncbi:MAG: hypothetical protein DRO11_02535 [Methanobacteriota archaeon]|nr:MAG: hypothetical protein DRO11_02535 [Euryarchaeota archaeon]
MVHARVVHEKHCEKPCLLLLKVSKVFPQLKQCWKDKPQKGRANKPTKFGRQKREKTPIKPTQRIKKSRWE